ncbi:hypothetical protein ACFLYU_04075 [Candidatus Dependentiae bacterium]
MYKTIIKIITMSLLMVFSIKPLTVSLEGLTEQTRQLTETVSSCISQHNNGQDLDTTLLTNKVQEKSDDLGLSLEFALCKNEHVPKAPVVENNLQVQDHAQDYKLSGTCRCTGLDICDISIEKSPIGEYACSTDLDFNKDGCMINNEDGSLSVADKLESVFIMSGNSMKEGTSADFDTGGANVYKIKMLPSLHQKLNGPCGYYALFNLLNMYNGKKSPTELLDRKQYETLFKEWKAYCKDLWVISNYDLRDLIMHKIPDLHKENVAISCCDINYTDEFDPKYVFTFGKDKHSIVQRVQDFRENGTPQYLIVGTNRETRKDIPSVNIQWDDYRGRRACPTGHWIAIKLEWAGKKGESPVIVSVSDSSGAQDNRFTAIIHWYYYMFAHKDTYNEKSGNLAQEILDTSYSSDSSDHKDVLVCSQEDSKPEEQLDYLLTNTLISTESKSCLESSFF